MSRLSEPQVSIDHLVDIIVAGYGPVEKMLSRGRRFIPSHSVGELAREAARLNTVFARLADKGKTLDRHYLVSRYPDALSAPAIPAESYTRDDAEEASDVARSIFNAAGGAMAPPI